MFDSGDDGRVGPAQVGLQLLRAQGGQGQSQGPAGQAHLGQGAAAHPADAFHHLHLEAWSRGRGSWARASARPVQPLSGWLSIRRVGMAEMAWDFQIKPKGALKASQGQLVGPQGTGEGVLRECEPSHPGLPRIRPAWGPPRSLSPLKVTRSTPAGTDSLNGGLPLQAIFGQIHQAAAAQVLHHRETVCCPGPPAPLRPPRR